MLTDLDDIENRQNSSRKEDKRDEIRLLESEIEQQKKENQTNHRVLRDFLGNLQKLKNKLAKIQSENNQMADEALETQGYFQQDKSALEKKTPGYLEIYQDNLRKRDAIADLEQEKDKIEQEVDAEIKKAIELNDEVQKKIDERDELLKEIQKIKNTEIGVKIIKKIATYFILLKLKRMEEDAKTLRQTIEELKQRLKDSDTNNATK